MEIKVNVPFANGARALLVHGRFRTNCSLRLVRVLDPVSADLRDPQELAATTLTGELEERLQAARFSSSTGQEDSAVC
jgi:hypothetical protein